MQRVNCKSSSPHQAHNVKCAKGVRGGIPTISYCTRCAEREPIEPNASPTFVPLRTTRKSSRHQSSPAKWIDRGPALWSMLHRWALGADLADVPRWLRGFTTQLNEENCACRAHWIAMLKKTPAPTTSHAELFKWTVDRHNEVNRRLGKPEMSYEAAAIIYGASA